MRLKKNIFIISSIIVLLIGVILVLTFMPDNSTENNDSNDIREEIAIEVLKIDSDIKSYKHSGQNAFEIIYINDKWSVLGNENIKLQQSVVDSVITTVSNLTTKTVVEENAIDLIKYGLNEPTQKIEIVDAKDKNYVINIGTSTATNSGYFSMVDNTNKVFVLDLEKYNLLCGGLDSLRNKNVVSIKGDIESVTISNPDTTITIQPRTTENPNASSFSKWEMIKPYKKDVNEYIFEENVINALDFNITSFIDDSPKNYSDYGLSNPKHWIEIKTLSNSYKILFGNLTDDNNIFMKVDGEPNVYAISKESVKYIDYTPVYLLDSLVFSRNISSVETIEFQCDKKYTLKIDGETFLLDNKKVDEDDFRNTYLSLISGIISGEAEPGKSKKEICRFTFNYNTNTPSETVVFYEYDELYASVSIDNRTEFYIKRSYADDMIKAIKNLSDN